MACARAIRTAQDLSRPDAVARPRSALAHDRISDGPGELTGSQSFFEASTAVRNVH